MTDDIYLDKETDFTFQAPKLLLFYSNKKKEHNFQKEEESFILLLLGLHLKESYTGACGLLFDL